jgi:hypothetical protein
MLEDEPREDEDESGNEDETAGRDEPDELPGLDPILPRVPPED